MLYVSVVYSVFLMCHILSHLHHPDDCLSVCLHFQGVPCDLVTGEERTFVDLEGRAAGHVACTIEMCSVTTPCE